VNATGSPIIEDTLVQVTGTASQVRGIGNREGVQFEPDQKFEVEFRTSL